MTRSLDERKDVVVDVSVLIVEVRRLKMLALAPNERAVNAIAGMKKGLGLEWRR